MRARSFASPFAEALLRPPRHDGQDRGNIDDAAERPAKAEEPPDMLCRGPRGWGGHLHDLPGGDAEERLYLVDQERDAEVTAAEEEPAPRPRSAMGAPGIADEGCEIVGGEEPGADPHDP